MQGHSEIFENYGYLIIRKFVDAKIINQIHELFLQREPSILKEATSLVNLGLNFFDKSSIAVENGTIKYLKNAHFFFKEFKPLVDAKLINLVNDISREDLHLIDIELHQKLPGVSCTPPHQDNFYFGLNLKKNIALTAYLALNYQDSDSGVLGVYPNSHKLNLEHQGSNIIGFSSGINETILDNYNLDVTPLYPGDLIIHHCNVVHAASKNNADYRRSNLAFRFFPKDPIYDVDLQMQYKKFRANSNRGI